MWVYSSCNFVWLQIWFPGKGDSEQFPSQAMNPDIEQIFSLLKALSTQHKTWTSLALKHKLTFSLQAVP